MARYTEKKGRVMKQKKWMGVLAVVITTTMPTAFALTTYVGADVQMRRMDFKGGFGDNLLQHHSPQGNIYAGLKLNEMAGIEAGYEATTTRTRTVTLTTGDVVNGATLSAPMSPAVFKSKAKIKGPHIEAVGYYSFQEVSPLQLIGTAGVSVFKATAERRTISTAGFPGRTTRKLVQHKTVLRLTGGLQYALDENWFARLTVGWVNTSKMTIYAKDGVVSNTHPAIKPKNSTVYGLGMGWIF
jgi:opacity protein-like surface antigen